METHDARNIITSDGTDVLRFRDPVTFKEARHIEVRDGGRPVDQLNELEYIRSPKTKGGGEIYANVWHSNRIARIASPSVDVWSGQRIGARGGARKP